MNAEVEPSSPAHQAAACGFPPALVKQVVCRAGAFILPLVMLPGCVPIISEGLTADTDRYLLIRRARIAGGALITPVEGSGDGVGIYQGPEGRPEGICVRYAHATQTEQIVVWTQECRDP